MPKAPTFAASILRLTAEGEQVSVNCTASTEAELGKHLAACDRVSQQQRTRNNERVLAVGERVAAETGVLMARAVRAICEAAGIETPEEYRESPAPNGHETGGAHADDSRGVVHPATDS